MSDAPAYSDLVYEDRTVAFIDVLGWRNATIGAGARSPGDLGWAVHLVRQVAAQVEAHRKFFSDLPIPMPGMGGAAEVSQFSDSIVISMPYGEGQYLFESYIDQLTSMACQNRLLLRGGIVRGELYHRGGMVYGPALIAAFDLEQSASVPKIILHKSLEEEFLKGTQMYDDNGVPYGYRKAWRRDHDGSLFYDFMQPFGAHHVFEGSGRLPWKANIHQLSQYKYLILNGVLGNQGNVGVIQKYMWAFRYFLDVMAEYSDIKIPTMAVETDAGLLGFDQDHWPHVMVTKSVGGQQ